MRKIVLFIGLLCFALNISAQSIVYSGHTEKSARILETNLKKVTKFGEKSRAFYMWAGLTSLDIKGVVIYSVKVMYTSEYRLSVEKGDTWTLTLKNGTKIVLRSPSNLESKRLDGVETLFVSYEINESDLLDLKENGVINIAPAVNCFGSSEYSKDVNMWKLARPLSLRYDLLKEYIDKHPE